MRSSRTFTGRVASTGSKSDADRAKQIATREKLERTGIPAGFNVAQSTSRRKPRARGRYPRGRISGANAMHDDTVVGRLGQSEQSVFFDKL